MGRPAMISDTDISVGLPQDAPWVQSFDRSLRAHANPMTEAFRMPKGLDYM